MAATRPTLRGAHRDTRATPTPGEETIRSLGDHLPGDERSVTDVLAGVLLGGLLGLVVGVLGQVQEPEPLAVAGGSMIGALGMVRWTLSRPSR